MYDITVATIDLTSDEIDLIKMALEKIQDTTVGVAEVLTIESLLDKLDGR